MNKVFLKIDYCIQEMLHSSPYLSEKSMWLSYLSLLGHDVGLPATDPPIGFFPCHPSYIVW